jgi:hypothetical protein
LANACRLLGRRCLLKKFGEDIRNNMTNANYWPKAYRKKMEKLKKKKG